MRLRKNAKMHEAIKHFDDVVLWDENAKNYFAEFKNLKIEIGMGKGKFLTQKAQLDKEDFFVGIESQTEVAYLAALKVKENNSSNIKIIKANAENINEWFLPEQVSTIYINFCDPWPKARHAKRRLVSRNFIEKYKKIVTSDAEIYFKTDNKLCLNMLWMNLSFVVCKLKMLQLICIIQILQILFGQSMKKNFINFA